MRRALILQSSLQILSATASHHAIGTKARTPTQNGGQCVSSPWTI
jgi:hypothetical protein